MCLTSPNQTIHRLTILYRTTPCLAIPYRNKPYPISFSISTRFKRIRDHDVLTLPHQTLPCHILPNLATLNRTSPDLSLNPDRLERSRIHDAALPHRTPLHRTRPDYTILNHIAPHHILDPNRFERLKIHDAYPYLRLPCLAPPHHASPDITEPDQITHHHALPHTT